MKIRGTTITTPVKPEAVVDDKNICQKPWSSKNTVDKLCPSFTESGAVVQCQPLEGYPLEVVSTIDYKGDYWESVTLTQSNGDTSTTFTVDFANLDEAHVLFGSYNWQTGVLDTGDDGYYQHDPETDTFTMIDDPSTYVPHTVRNIYAVSGTNSFYSDCGKTTVLGRTNMLDDSKVGEAGWSSKNIVEKLCPSFTESGGVVTCEPVEGYPLEVVSHVNKAVSGVTLQHCLTLDPNIYEFFNAYIDVNRQMWLANADSRSIRMPCKPNTTYVISHNNSMETIFRVACIETDAVPSGATVPTAVIVQGQTDALTVSTTKQTKYLVVQASKAQWDNTITSLIVCEARTVNHVDFGKTVNGGTYNWALGILTDEKGNTTTLTPNTVTAFDGINVFVSDCGDTTVSGKSDPVAIIEKQETIIAEQEAELAKLNKQYELIEEVTLEEAVASISRNADTNGAAYDFSAIRIHVQFAAADASARAIIRARDADGGNVVYHAAPSGSISTSERHLHLMAYNDRGLTYYASTVSSSGAPGAWQAEAAYNAKYWKNIKTITLSVSASSVPIPAGTRILIYGIRG